MTFPPKDVTPGLGWPGDGAVQQAAAPGLGWPGVNEAIAADAPPSGHASWGSTTSGTAETGFVPTGAAVPAPGPGPAQGPGQGSAQGESQLVREALKDVDVSRETTAARTKVRGR